MIKEVQIGGQLRSVSFAFSTLALFGDMTGRTLMELTNLVNSMKPGEIKTLIWCSLKMGAKQAGRDNVPTVDEIEGWIDEDPSVISQVMGIYVDAQAKDKKKEPVKRKR